jgi:hypothetical protein
VLLEGRKDYDDGQSRLSTPSFISSIDDGAHKTREIRSHNFPWEDD